MLSKKTLEKVLNNKYSSMEIIDQDSTIKLSHKRSFMSLKVNTQTLQFYEVENLCIAYANINNFKDKLEKADTFIEWFTMYERVFNASKN